MSQLGIKKVGLGRRFVEGAFVGLGIASGLILFQGLFFVGLNVAKILGY